MDMAYGKWYHEAMAEVIRLRAVLKYAKALLSGDATAKVKLEEAIADAEKCKMKKKWSKNYDRCRMCWRSDIPHGGFGLCISCNGKRSRKEKGR